MSTTHIRGKQILDADITSDDLADGSVQGATGNAGTQREIATGTVSTPDLRNDAVDATKLLETDSYSMGAVTTPILKITIGASDPESPVEGQIWYNSTVHQLKMYNGTSTVLLG